VKVNINFKNGTKIKRLHVCYISTDKKSNQIWLYRYIYQHNSRKSVEEIFKFDEIDFISANQPEKVDGE